MRSYIAAAAALFFASLTTAHPEPNPAAIAAYKTFAPYHPSGTGTASAGLAAGAATGTGSYVVPAPTGTAVAGPKVFTGGAAAPAAPGAVNIVGVNAGVALGGVAALAAFVL